MPISIVRFDMRRPHFASAGSSELYAAALDMAQYADEKGLSGITLSEHHGTDDGYLPAPLSLAGCMLGRTREIRIAVAALLVPLHDPLALAEELAVLDLASGGRIAITAGLGYRPEEYEMMGRDWKRRGKLLDECLTTLQQAFTGEPFEYRGRTVQVTPRPATAPHPPVFVGGLSAAAARRAARFGLPFQPSTDSEDLAETYRAACEEHGTAPVLIPPGSGEQFYVAEDPDRAWAEVGEHLLHDAKSYASWQQPGQVTVVHSGASSVEELRAEGKYRIVTPDECVERAKAQGPLSTFVLHPLMGGMSPEQGWSCLRLFAEDALPRMA
ncbi:MAG: LLM class flavin-dependent oxidoreductase [Myxococcota bacterium]|nr:LLM class flavin-dependent oxidoreductase [Myxococcota bacterium]